MPKKELAKGYTTGTCAQAATRAAMQMLFTGEKVEQVSVELPQGEKLRWISRIYRENIQTGNCRIWYPVRSKKTAEMSGYHDGVLVYSRKAF